MIVRDINKARLMVYVQHDEEEKLKDIEKFQEMNLGWRYVM